MTTQAAATPGETRELSPWPAILLATLAGAIVRAAPVVQAGFPVNDGGLFASMVDDILKTGQAIPAWTSYNGLGGPFAYPPLAFIVTAGLETLMPLGTVEWLRWIPLLSAIATVPAFALLATVLAPSRVHVAIATFVFALVPRSFEWLVMGGGLTRAPGVLLAILSIYLGIRFLKTGGRAWLGAGIVLGLTVLTHPQAGLFAAISLSLATLAYARGRRAWSRMIAAAAVGLLVTSPWLLVVMTRYGIGPLLSAGGTGVNLVQSIFYLLTATVTDEPLWKLAAGLGVLGVIYSLSLRRFFVPAWAAVLVLADPRGAATVVSAPLSLLAAVGLQDVVVARIGGVGGDLLSAPGWPTPLLRSRSVRAVLGGALLLGMLSATLAPYVLSPMATLGSDERSAMTWSRDSLPPAARVVIVTGRPWYEDATSEWFPYLAGRVSVATVQGHEWLGSTAWQRQLGLADALLGRAKDTVAALAEWARRFGVEYDYVYLPKGRLGGVTPPEDCCGPMRATLRESVDYEIVYDGVGATIARRIGN
jgi:hypothetical protein